MLGGGHPEERELVSPILCCSPNSAVKFDSRRVPVEVDRKPLCYFLVGTMKTESDEGVFNDKPTNGILNMGIRLG